MLLVSVEQARMQQEFVGLEGKKHSIIYIYVDAHKTIS